MTYTYTTPTLVANELRATQDFSASTIPTANTVNGWIEEISDKINTDSASIFGTTEVTETLDYQGEEILTLKKAPINSVTSVLYSTSSLGTDTYGLSATKTEDTHYTVYGDSGEIAILPKWVPQVGRKRIQVTYNAGPTTTPPRVQMLATKLVAKRTIDTLLSKDINEKQSGKSVSVGSISIVKPADFGVAQYEKLIADTDKLQSEILNGTTAYRIGTHRY